MIAQPRTWDLTDPSGPFMREFVYKNANKVQSDLWAGAWAPPGASGTGGKRAGGDGSLKLTPAEGKLAARHTPTCKTAGLQAC